MRTALFLIFVAAFLPACATKQLAAKEDYLESRLELANGNSEQARKAFHDREAGGFITTAEKTWLDLLHTTPDTAAILRTSGDIEKRKTVYISQELFYKETEEGYFPAEHEVIYYHLLAALSFAKLAKPAEARVEVAKATHYLEKHYSHERGSFDDPYLRLILASLWTYLGEWEHARVDFRVLSQLSPASTWAKQLSEMERPPAEMQLIFAGTGPLIDWNRITSLSELSGTNRLKFTPSYGDYPVRLVTGKEKPKIIKEKFATLGWYERHRNRNDSIREAIKKSQYMAEATGRGGMTALNIGMHKIGALGITTLGVGIGLTIAAGSIYLAGQTGNGEILTYGLLLGVASAVYIGNAAWAAEGKASAKAMGDLDAQMNLSKQYRYLRFIPDSLYFSFSEKPTQGETAAENDSFRTGPFLALTSAKGAKVKYFFIPNDGKIRNGLVWTDPRLKHQWLYAGHAKTYDDAANACRRASRENFQNWTMPTWNELFEANQSGITDPEKSDGSFYVREKRVVWLGKGPHDDFKCKAAKVEGKVLELDTSCDRPALALCFQPAPPK